MPPAIKVLYPEGIYLPEIDLWLDPQRGKERAFVSHAHSDHFARHQWTLCTEATKALITSRYGVPKKGVRIGIPYREPFELDGYSLIALPAGHIFGSAMLHVTRMSDGATLLYTGDFKLRDSLTCEPVELRQANTLILETTFGLPQYRFPPRAEVIADMLRFVNEAVEAGLVPVLFGYSLGKAQELLSMLHGCAHPIMIHESITKMVSVFQAHGHTFPEHRELDLRNAGGHVLIVPPNTIRELRDPTKYRTAMASGWSLMKGAKYRYGVDVVFPLSDHADHPELLETVEKTRPSLIYTVHGFTTEFAKELRLRGLEAWSLIKEEQREFLL